MHSFKYVFSKFSSPDISKTNNNNYKNTILLYKMLKFLLMKDSCGSKLSKTIIGDKSLNILIRYSATR